MGNVVATVHARLTAESTFFVVCQIPDHLNAEFVNTENVVKVVRHPLLHADPLRNSGKQLLDRVGGILENIFFTALTAHVGIVVFAVAADIAILPQGTGSCLL